MKDKELLAPIFNAYFKEGRAVRYEALSIGHINDTFKIYSGEQSFLLQRINQEVFKDPSIVVENYQLVYDQLKTKLPELSIPRLIPNLDQQFYQQDLKGNYWRVVEFVENSKAFETVTEAQQVKTAAAALGRFVAALNTPPVPSLKATIPEFHYFGKRYSLFQQICEADRVNRKNQALPEIEYLEACLPDLIEFNHLNLPLRLVHNDPKISNLLYDSNNHVLAVIDWDTIMPGFLAMDFGDMVRSMAVTASEEEQELEKVNLRTDYLELICANFIPPLQPFLSEKEKESFHLGAEYILLEQMLRFLSDYLKGDLYYKTHYPEQNLHRAQNQMRIHQQLVQYRAQLFDWCRRYY